MKNAILILSCGLVLALNTQAQPDLQAEYFFDADPGVGNGISVVLPSGPSPSLSTTLDITGLSPGVHLWYVRTKQNGVWGHYGERRLFYLWETEGASTATNIDAAEYFFDADPGPGNGEALTVSPGGTLTESALIDITGLAPGVHLWYVRTKQNGTWGHYGQRRLFFIWEPDETSDPPTDIEAAEYFFDADPGVGNGIVLPVTAGASLTESALIDITGLSEGVHLWYVRTKQNGVWGFYGQRRLFYLWESGSVSPPTEIDAAEYFFDNDPGPGNGTALPVTAGGNLIESAVIDITGLAAGPHLWYVRTKQNRAWGFYGERKLFFVWDPGDLQVATDIEAAEYFIDTDPGPGNGTPIAVTPGPTPFASALIDITGLAPGTHYWNVRVKQNGSWGLYGEQQPFAICPEDAEPAIVFAPSASCNDATFTVDVTMPADWTGDPFHVINNVNAQTDTLAAGESASFGPFNTGTDLLFTAGSSVDPFGCTKQYHAELSCWYEDQDSDGFGDPTSSVVAVDQPAGYVADDTDNCPTDPNKIEPGICGCGIADVETIWYADVDEDSFGDPNVSQPGYTCIQPPGYVEDDQDLCPDDPNKIDPGVCGCGVEDVPTTWYADVDNDGFGDPSTGQAGYTCIQPPGHVQNSSDNCPDDANKVDPGICGCGVSDIDSDSDTVADCIDGCPLDPLKIAPGACGCGVVDVATIWYADTDNDGFGDPTAGQAGFTCIQPPGYVADNTDSCPDDANKIEPGVCGCGVADVATTWYADTDNDGFGDPTAGQAGYTCIQPPGYVADNTDNCPDDPDKIDPGVCGCGVADVAIVWYADTDNDGFGDPTDGLAGFTCIQPAGYVADNTDNCPDDPDKIDPGVCGCGIADVATTWYADTDNDGFGDPTAGQAGYTCIQPPGYVADNTDNCPDDPDKIEPGVCGCGVADVAIVWYTDTDNDGFGDPTDGLAGFTCIQPPGYVADNTDNCPDDANKIDPGVCGCGVADVATTWYADTDNDGFGDPTDGLAGFTCIQPPGYVVDNTDNCPDDANKIEPGVCGCGVADVATTWYADTDNDGFGDPTDGLAGFTCIQPPGYVVDNTDNCPDDPNKIEPGVCGCGVADLDTDQDGIPDCIDPCPLLANLVPGNTCDDGNPNTFNDVVGSNCVCAGTMDVDCNGVPGGSAFTDNCGTCVGGDTGLDPCVADCNGVFGGSAFTDNCGTCVGGDTGLDPCVTDCNGAFGGSAFTDNCGTCVGGDTGLDPCVEDCNGVFGGSAFTDNCGTCVGGDTGLDPCEADCNGVFGGSAFTDNCGTCVGGDTGLDPCVEDCNGVFGGSAFTDNCGTCVDGDTGLDPCVADCNGVFGGSAFTDNCGTCVGGDTGLDPCVADCNGVFGGSAFIDNCGTCVGGDTGLDPCVADCNGVFGGSAFTDNCGTCVGGDTGLDPCVADCNGVFGGSAFTDNCGTCVGGDTGLDPCAADCNGDFGGSAFTDNCGTCVGGNTGLDPCVQDCNGVYGGTAFTDNCGTCVGGDTGLDPCVADCNGDFGGSAFTDNCGTCVGGDTGLDPCVQDCNGVFGGSAFIDNCGTCVGGDTGLDPCVADCNGVFGGSAFTDNCGTCVGGDTGLDPCTADCNGVFGGTAFLDNCGTCVGGDTGLDPCVADCNGDFGGTAFLDNCGTCVGGDTGLDQCVADCNGVFGGTAFLDNCGTCVGGDTGLDPCVQDCNGVFGGSAFTDNCGTCVGGDTGLDPCVADCNGDFGGSAFTDNCGTCVGGDTGLDPCVADCNGVFGGSAFTDNCGTCVGGDTGLDPCVADCNAVFGGTAFTDNCGTCVGGDTGLDPCSCDPALIGQPCGSTIGACIPGVWACVDGAMSCVGAVLPSPEVCDGIDNDCDGIVDEDCAPLDCNGDSGGTAYLDPCGICVGGNTNLSTVVATAEVINGDCVPGTFQVYVLVTEVGGPLEGTTIDWTIDGVDQTSVSGFNFTTLTSIPANSVVFVTVSNSITGTCQTELGPYTFECEGCNVPFDSEAGEDALVFYGPYSGQACAPLLGTASGGTAYGDGSYLLQWDNGPTVQGSSLAMEVCPTSDTAYTLTVTDANGCTTTDEVTVFAVNTQCGGQGGNQNKVRICINGQNVCIALQAVETVLANNPNATLGPCPKSIGEAGIGLSIYPNPTNGLLVMLGLEDVPGDVEMIGIELLDLTGKRVQVNEFASQGSHFLTQLELGAEVAPGIYLVQVRVGERILTDRLVVAP